MNGQSFWVSDLRVGSDPRAQPFYTRTFSAPVQLCNCAFVRLCVCVSVDLCVWSIGPLIFYTAQDRIIHVKVVFLSAMTSHKHISLFQLQTLVKSVLERELPLSHWVTAEIGELKVNQSGHCYLELVEKGGANQVPRARANAVIWRGTYGTLRSYFTSATGRELERGMNVLLKMSVTYHELYGLSFVVSDIDPLYTLGDMERQRQETIDRLRAEGVFDMNRSLGLPFIVQSVAVVSSRNAAGYQDFMNELASGGYRFEVTLFEAVMQGHATEDSVIDALERIIEDGREFDAVVIIRGGGSQSDLAAFDSYRLSSHVAQFPIAVVTGIGHDKDQSVTDLVACLSLKTPTAVAAWLVAGLTDFENYLNQLQDSVLRSADAYFERERRRLQIAAMQLSQTSGALTRRMEVRLERLAGELRRRQDNMMLRMRNRLGMLSSSLRERVSARLVCENARLAHAEQMTLGRRPDAILALGFAIVRRGGAAVKDASTLNEGDRLDVSFFRGSAITEVKSTDYGKE